MNKKTRAYEELKRRIINLEFPPGSPMNEAEVALLIGVSKTPLREALTQLERDGLVENVRGRGSNITQITAFDVENVLQIREIIESGVARRIAAAGGTPVLIRERDSMDALLDEDDLDGNIFEWGSHEDIHQILVEALGNDLLTQTYQGLMDRIGRIRNYYGDRFTRRRKHDIVTEHLAILDAVIGGNADLAEARMSTHLQNARSFLGGLNEIPMGVNVWSMS